MTALSSRQRAHLKRLAHHLAPVVQIGKDGLSEPVLRQIADALEYHELIKVKLGDGSPLDRDAATATLPGAIKAHLVQNIGKVFILYRPHPEHPEIVLPEASPADE